MQATGTRSLLLFFGMGLVMVLVSLLSVKAYAEETRQAHNDAYLEQVVGVLRSHVLSMRMILDHEGLKYADNIVRHAEAFERSFGMIGPMEWHVAEAFSYSQKSDAKEKLSQEQFEELAENSRVAISRIKKSAMRYVRDKNKDLMRQSINDMMKSCGACHSKLPEGTVPRVWKGMKE